MTFMSENNIDKIRYGHRNLYYEIMLKYIFNYILLIHCLLLIVTRNIFFKKTKFLYSYPSPAVQQQICVV